MTEKDLGFKIKKLREEKQMSQEELALQLNISQSKLSKIENGQLKADLIFIMGICNCFCVEITYFLSQFI